MIVNATNQFLTLQAYLHLYQEDVKGNKLKYKTQALN